MAYAGPIAFPVIEGGTGDTSFTAYSVITGGTTSTGALQNVSGVGTSGQVLTSNGAAALPTWQNTGSGGTGDAKAWALVAIDGSGNPTLTVGFNVASVASAAGGFSVTLTSGFSSSNYVIVATGGIQSQNDVIAARIVNATSFVVLIGSSLSTNINVVAFGT